MWKEREISFKMVRWENFLDVMSAGGLQSEYNKAVESCDIFVLLAHNKVGKYTAEEFDRAFGQFSRDAASRCILTYFKEPMAPGISTPDLMSLVDFQDPR